MITFSVESPQFISVKGGSFDLTVNYGQSGYADPVLNNPDMLAITAATKGLDKAVYKIRVKSWDTSTSTTGRLCIITFKVGTETAGFEVVQYSNCIPVWKDTPVSVIENNDNTEYFVKNINSGKVIYKGIAAYIPGATNKILLNRIIANSLEPQYLLYPAEEQFVWETLDDDVLRVKVYTKTRTVGCYSFIRDYSGYTEYTGSLDLCRNKLINNRINYQMVPSISLYDNLGQTFIARYSNASTNIEEVFDDVGTTTSISAEIAVKPDYDHIEILDLEEQSYLQLDLVCTGNAALYYLNKLGAWDYFLVEGNVIKSVAINRLSYTKDAVNKPLGEKLAYESQVKTNWTINTGYLTDKQSAILAEQLLSSNNVYLQYFKTGELVPVILNTTSSEVKNYKNGRKLAQYTIQAETRTQDLTR